MHIFVPFLKGWTNAPTTADYEVQRWLAEGTGRTLGGQVVVLQLAWALMPVRQSADPAAGQMGETASAGKSGREVNVDVVQVQASPGIGSDVHLTPPSNQHLTDTVSANWQCAGIPPWWPAKTLASIGTVGHSELTLLPAVGKVLM
jgi:hypothetical protein